MINIIKNILSDLSLLYKNFIHWNISKIIIYISAFLLGILLSLPFFIVLFAMFFLDPIDWRDIIATYSITNSVGLSVLTAFSTYYGYLIVEAIIFILGVLFFSFGYSYYVIPLTNLYIWYIQGGKLPFFSNLYFNFRKILSYICIFLWGTLAFFVPALIFLILFFVALFGLGGIDNVFQTYENGTISLFSIVIGIILLLCIIIFIYFAFRVSFSYVILLDENYKFDREKNESYSNKIMIGVVCIFVLFLAIVGGASYYFLGLEGFSYITIFLGILLGILGVIFYNIRGYLIYIIESIKITAGTKIFKFLLVMIIYSLLMLLIEFLAGFLENLGDFGYFLYSILTFLFISCLFEMIFVSSYRNIMTNRQVFDAKVRKDDGAFNDEVALRKEIVEENNIGEKTHNK